jgi:prepilin-type N-terminal cleavage/methylation domain-containing protein
MKKAFTLVELLVVIAMIAVLTGAMTVAVNGARTRAKISKATQEAKEMTNAILAGEQYARGRTLEDYANGSWADCSEGAKAMRLILGGETSESGETIPVLFNANLSRGYQLDPWGKPYQYMIQKTASLSSDDATGGKVQFCTAPALPNFFRLTDKERRCDR